jgi:hypothetical protein
MLDVRQERGREIAERMRIVKSGGAWIVPSQSGQSPYRVTLDSGDIRCTCEDFSLRAKPCTHVYAAAFTVERLTVTERKTVTTATETTVTETRATAVRVTYKQNWPAYNRA